MGKVKDVDAAARAQLIKICTWAAPSGVPAFIVVLLLALDAKLPFLAALALAIAAGIATYIPFALMAVFLLNRFGAGLERMTNPSGNIPPKRDYSYATSLMIRGKYEEAAAAYEQSVVEFPADPDPYLLLARLHRDRLGRFDDAAAWFQRALAIEDVPPEAEIVAIRELTELYTHKLARPAKALPLLARTAEKFADGPHGQWAARELALLQERLRQAAAEELGRA